LIEMSIKLFQYPNGSVGLRDFHEVFSGSEFIRGRTGSGKTTILRMMNGLIPNFYSGELIGRISICGSKPNPRDVYLVKQEPEEMVTCCKVIDELVFPLVQRGVSLAEAKREAESICEEIGIGDLLWREVFTLSIGELQLVEIAAGIALSPLFLILDEPFAHLSRRNAMRVLKMIKDYRHIVAEHRLEFEPYFDRVVDLGLEEIEVEIEKPEFGDVLYDGKLSLREGELIAIVGDNGAGKTTLLKEIARDLSSKRRKFGLVLQSPPYHLCKNTVRDEVEERFLKEFELESVASRHPQSLSSGQMRRVAIAKAFSSDIVLLDEPTAGQDINFRRKLVQLLRKYKKSAIIATHDEELAKLCDKVVEV